MSSGISVTIKNPPLPADGGDPCEIAFGSKVMQASDGGPLERL